jgi:hypothetical protein
MTQAIEELDACVPWGLRGSQKHGSFDASGIKCRAASFIQGRWNASSHRTISAAHWLARKQFEGHPSALGIAGGDFLAELRQGHHSTPGDEL